LCSPFKGHGLDPKKTTGSWCPRTVAHPNALPLTPAWIFRIMGLCVRSFGVYRRVICWKSDFSEVFTSKQEAKQ
jgi:hypothetical protein